MATLYILESKKLGKFYTGSCKNLEERLAQHKQKTFSDSFTRQSNDWELFLVMDNLEYEQARKIETHIKKMKSRTYINNLKKHPEMRDKLILKYN